MSGECSIKIDNRLHHRHLLLLLRTRIVCLGLCPQRRSMVVEIIRTEWPLLPNPIPKTLLTLTMLLRQQIWTLILTVKGLHFHGGSISRTQGSTVHLISVLNNLDVRSPFIPLAFMVNFCIFPPGPHIN